MNLFAIFDSQPLSQFDNPKQDDIASMLTKELYQSVQSNKIMTFDTAKEQPMFNFFDDAPRDVVADDRNIDLDFNSMFERTPEQEEDFYSMFSCQKQKEDYEVNPMDLTILSNVESNERQSSGFNFSLVKPHAIKQQNHYPSNN